LYDYAYDFSHISCHNTDPYRSDTATACSDHPATATAAAGRLVTDITDILHSYNEPMKFKFRSAFPVKILQSSFLVTSPSGVS